MYLYNPCFHFIVFTFFFNLTIITHLHAYFKPKLPFFNIFVYAFPVNYKIQIAMEMFIQWRQEKSVYLCVASVVSFEACLPLCVSCQKYVFLTTTKTKTTIIPFSNSSVHRLSLFVDNTAVLVK